MEVRCYIAMFLFAALSTVLGYMVLTRVRAKTSNAAPAAAVATSATPLLVAGQSP